MTEKTIGLILMTTGVILIGIITSSWVALGVLFITIGYSVTQPE